MEIIPLPSGKTDIASHMSITESLLSRLWIEMRYEDFITPSEIHHIQQASESHACLEVSDKQHYVNDAENGVLKLYRWDKLLGYIFAHSWTIHGIDYHERGSLWVDKSLYGKWLWKYLMAQMTEKLEWENILSVTSNTIVQNVNELLMDYEILNPNYKLREMVEARWEMKPDYRYFTNERLMRLL